MSNCQNILCQDLNGVCCLTNLRYLADWVLYKIYTHEKFSHLLLSLTWNHPYMFTVSQMEARRHKKREKEWTEGKIMFSTAAILLPSLGQTPHRQNAAEILLTRSSVISTMGFRLDPPIQVLVSRWVPPDAPGIAPACGTTRRHLRLRASRQTTRVWVRALVDKRLDLIALVLLRAYWKIITNSDQDQKLPRGHNRSDPSPPLRLHLAANGGTSTAREPLPWETQQHHL